MLLKIIVIAYICTNIIYMTVQSCVLKNEFLCNLLMLFFVFF